MKMVPNQPYLFPQLHWWRRNREGLYVVLDNVHRSTSQPSNRALVRKPGPNGGYERTWLTMPVHKEDAREEIRKVRLAKRAIECAKDGLEKLKSYYGKAPYRHHAEALYDAFGDYLNEDEEGPEAETMLDLVMSSILVTSRMLSLSMEMEYASHVKIDPTLTKTPRLVALALELKADTVVLGGGEAYLDADRPLYEKAGLRVEVQNWKCPVENLSVLDTMAMYGRDRTREILCGS